MCIQEPLTPYSLDCGEVNNNKLQNYLPYATSGPI